MNLIGPGLLDAETRAQLVADVASLLHDTDASGVVVVRTRTTTGFDTGSGVISGDVVEDSITAYVGPIAQRYAGADTPYQASDVVCIANAADLSTAPTMATTFRAGGITYRVPAGGTPTLDPLGLHWWIPGRARA